jgi:ABC-type uncharacterized transport system involved in gliding motility auxiliary subunit
MAIPPPRPSFSTGRRWNAALLVSISTLAVLALVVMANYLAARHYHRHTWSADDREALSPLTLEVLRSLTNQVKVIVFYDPDEPLYSHVTAMLKEYSRRNPRVQLEVINYVNEPDKAGLLKATYKLSAAARDLVIFDCNSRVEFVPQSVLSELDPTKLIKGESQVVKRKSFLGERFFTSKLLTVSNPKQPRACFLLGHREHDPTVQNVDEGYGRFAEVLRECNVQIASLKLMGTNEVPAECDLLVIAGPVTALHETEQARVEKYLEQGGRLLLLLNYLSSAGLEKILAKWNVEVGPRVVLDPEHRFSELDVIVGSYGSHPIVKPFSQSTTPLPLHLLLPRAIGARAATQSADAPQAVELAATGPNAVEIEDLKTLKSVGSPKSFPLMVAVEKGRVGNLASTRMVVAGDSQFLDNQMIGSAANRDFAWQAVNWLLDRSTLLQIGPRPFTEYTLNMTRAQTQSVRRILMAGVPGAVLLLGLAVWFRRRH